jgi:glycosyltransferase involved in cell wall biosynthesis
MSAPAVSFVIPTLNSARTLDACLSSIRGQTYGGPVEIVLADAGSTDETLEIASRHGVEQVLPNPLETGEAGKTVGARAARHEILAFVDSDNVLVGPDWLTTMMEPFRDAEVVSVEPLRWEYSPGYSYVDRYCALLGVNDPLSYFAGNYGRYSHLSHRWTALDVDEQWVDGYLRVRVDPAGYPTMGANGYLVRSAALRGILRGDFLFDIDAVGELARAGFDTVARVDVPIGHAYAGGYRDFARKTRRRARDYFFYRRQALRTYPWNQHRGGVARFVVATVLTLPVVYQAAVGYSYTPDRAWFFHPLACWTTLVIYAAETVRAYLRPARLSRVGWRQ